MASLYVSFITSEGIADRGEVSRETWLRWIEEDYVFGPFAAIHCVYGTLEGEDEVTGDLQTIAHLVHDKNDPFDGYWRIVKREIHERYPNPEHQMRDGLIEGKPRAWASPTDEKLPPFSDWSVQSETKMEPRRIRDVDVIRSRSDA